MCPALQVLTTVDQFALELMDCRGAEARLRTFQYRFTATEKAGEALRVFQDHVQARAAARPDAMTCHMAVMSGVWLACSRRAQAARLMSLACQSAAVSS